MRKFSRVFSSLVLLAFASVACGSIVREAVDAGNAGTPVATLTDLNGGLSLPGVAVDISPNVVATSPKIYLRKDKSTPPNCYYGLFVSDPAYLPGGDGGEQPNNGLLLVETGSRAAISASGISGCPTPDLAAVGGAIPDGVQPGDVLQVGGQLTPYCDSFDTRAEACAVPIFPEFTVAQLGDLMLPDGGSASAPVPVQPQVVLPSAISDASTNALAYAGMLLEVDDVTVSNAHPDAYTAVVVTPGNLWLDSFDTRGAVPQVLGTHFSKVIGNLHFSYGHWRLQPRSQADLQN